MDQIVESTIEPVSPPTLKARVAALEARVAALESQAHTSHTIEQDVLDQIAAYAVSCLNDRLRTASNQVSTHSA